ncbi:MAG TPA: extracellular solute-binding protein [Acetobacteraceae bacterium]|nr:extracellular solute-binding protein [Acetobacteraceae bacterium]
MVMSTRRIRRRQVLASAAGGAGLLMLPGKAPAQGGAKKLAGVTLNVSCWSSSYPQFLADYIPEFEKATGAKVNYETPSFPIYNQRMDLELSTKSDAHDVINVTFIYIGRWIGAGWVVPLTDYINDPRKTPADWDVGDFLPGSTAAFKDRQGRLCAIPWIADVQMAGASRYDLIQQAGMKLPDTFDEMATMLKAVNRKDGIPGFAAENHYGWTFIPFLQGFGGNVFRNAPTDLTPVLDSPEAVAAADFFSNMLREYGPDGVLSYTYDQVVEGLKQGRINYSTNNETFLVQMAGAGSKVAKTCALSLMPGGPKGRFPNVAGHGWGIPVGSRNKDAAWEFITWATSKQLFQRMFRDHGYSSVTRRSLIDEPEFRQKLQINGIDVAQLYLDTLTLGAKGYTIYRTVPPYPPIDHEIDVAIQRIISKQQSAKESMARLQRNALTQLKRAGVKL